MTRSEIVPIIFSFILIIFISGCQQETERSVPQTGDDAENTEKTVSDFSKAICILHPTEGNNVTGVVTFTKEGANIKVVADIQNLPEGSHGFHIHEFGDCSAKDGTSAGGHFNPENMEHGAQDDLTRHVGDFGNIEADSEGNAHKEFTDSFISFYGKHSIIGRGIIIHEKADDLKSQPTGNAGSRLACGVIGISGK